MKHKRSKSRRRPPAEAPPFLISGGYEADCPMCRAMEEEAGLFGDPMDLGGAEAREILDLERYREIVRKMEKGPWSWSAWDDED